jgi:hypothetical protein
MSQIMDNIEKRDRSHIRVGEDMVWPNLGTRLNDLEWNLRHNKAYTLTREDQLVLASLCSAYRDLIAKTNRERDFVCNDIKRKWKLWDHQDQAKKR